MLLALSFAVPATAAQNYTLEPIVLRGDAAPGTATTFSGFELPIAITETGVAFVADLFVPSGSGDAVYADVGAGLQLVALKGTPAPGLPGANIGGVGWVQLNGPGEVVYTASTWDGVNGVDTLYHWANGSATLLLKQGDAAPGPGLSFDGFTAPSLDAAGTVVFLGDVLDGQGSTTHGIFRSASGETTALLWEYAPAPGTGGGQLVSFGPPHLNAAGDVAFAASVANGSVDHGLFKLSGGNVETLVLENDVLPGTGGGSADNLDFSRIGLNATGTVAFVADVLGGNVDRGIFAISAGVVAPVALEGDPAPGTTGAVFDFLRRHIALDDASKVAYRADLSGGTETQGLFRGDQAVALIGEPLPGTGGGSVGVMSERPAMTGSGGTGFETAIFQGVGGRGLFRATPSTPAVPSLPASGAVALALLLAGCGSRRLARGFEKGVCESTSRSGTS